MLSRTIVDGDDFARSKAVEIIEELQGARLSSHIALFVSSTAFRAWWLATHEGMEKRDIARAEAERAQVGAELAISTCGSDEWLAVVATQMKYTWRELGDERSEKWQQLLAKLPADTVDRAYMAFGVY